MRIEQYDLTPISVRNPVLFSAEKADILQTGVYKNVLTQFCPTGLSPLLQSIGSLEQWRASERNAGNCQVRWRPQQIRLHVVITPPEIPIIPFPDYQALVLASLQAWEAAASGKITFCSEAAASRKMDVGCSEQGDIVVDWTDSPTPGRPFEVGHTERQIGNGGWIQHVKITLLQRPAIDAHLTAPERTLRLKATLLHEFGHALGLEHLNSPKDVMFHQGWRNISLSMNDERALRDLYSSKPAGIEFQA